MKKVLLVFAGLFLVIAFALFAQNFLRQNLSFFQQPASMMLGEDKITLEVADTPEERQKGLSGKRSLREDQGMLFIFEQPDMLSFWMKDMEFPLDIIFLNGNRVVTVHQNVQPPTDENADLQLYTSSEPSDRVLEFNAGTAAKYNIQQGTILEVENLK